MDPACKWMKEWMYEWMNAISILYLFFPLKLMELTIIVSLCRQIYIYIYKKNQSLISQFVQWSGHGQLQGLKSASYHDVQPHEELIFQQFSFIEQMP